MSVEIYANFSHFRVQSPKPRFIQYYKCLGKYLLMGIWLRYSVILGCQLLLSEVKDLEKFRINRKKYVHENY